MGHPRLLPGTSRRRAVSSAPVHSVDLFATVAELARVTLDGLVGLLPAGRTLDADPWRRRGNPAVEWFDENT